MRKAAELVLKRHIREKATIDHLVRKPPRPDPEEPEQSRTASTDRKPDNGGFPTPWPPAFLRSPSRLGGHGN
jgi:hypothetical protein